MPRKRGAQPGNQNARKHGFFARVLNKSDKRHYREAEELYGLDDEIKLLRAKIKTLVEHSPENLRLYAQAVATLGNLLRVRKYLGNSKEERLRQAVQRTLSKNPFKNL